MSDWKQWHKDDAVFYSAAKGGVTVSVGGRTSNWVRLIGGNLDATIRIICRELNYEIKFQTETLPINTSF